MKSQWTDGLGLFAKGESIGPGLASTLACRGRLASANIGNRMRDSHIWNQRLLQNCVFPVRSAGEPQDGATVEPGV
jgi:hypothetical protein